MNCEEFLRQFRDALDGKVPENLIQDNIKYYRSYIDSQTAAGRSESDVLRSLGDPRLLAKTIEESSKFASESKERWNRSAGDSSRMTQETYETAADNSRRRIPGWLITCLVVLVILVVLSVVFRVFVFLAPYIILFMLAGFVIRAVRGWWQNK
ncbi:MAG: DUF1700 domain-containing protein [Lachnospiraceae bacterium]|nr:DUF1700 domain-containing protein [Lachnospiraceae bacterium]